MVALGRDGEARALGRDGGGPTRRWHEPRRAPARPSAPALAYLLPLLGLLAGSSAFQGPWRDAPLPAGVRPQGIPARMLEPAALAAPASGAPPAVVPPPQTAALPPGPPARPESGKPPSPQVFTLPEAVAFGLQNSPRLRAAYAAIERA